MTKKPEKDPVIGNIVDAFEVLDLLVLEQPIGISAIAQKLKLPKTRIFRIIKSLEAVRAVRQLEDSTYCINFHMMKYSGSIQLSSNIVDVAEPHMRKAVDITGESINLGMAHGDDLLIIRRVHGEYYQLQTQLRPIGELYCSGMGKIFLAYRSDEDLKEYYKDLPKRTIRTINTYEGFKKEQDRIIETGISIDDEEFEYGLSCYAVPIYDQDGRPSFSLSVSGPTSRLEYKGLDDLLETLRKTAALIQKDMIHASQNELKID